MDFDKDKFCSAVNTGLFVYVNGDVKICCSGTHRIGSLKENTISEIFSSPSFIELKNAVDQEKPHPYCSGCVEVDTKAPNSSQRYSFNNTYPFKGDRNLRMVDIRWNDVCNLSCRYCNTNDSSEWKKIAGIPIESVKKSYIESVFQEIEAHKETIDSVFILGGEPLMQNYNLRLLDLIRKDAEINIITNGSTNLEKNNIYEKLKGFRNIHWNISFDNVGDKFEYVRNGGSWELLTHNIKKMLNDFGPCVDFHPIYTVWNATDLCEYYRFADSLGISDRVCWNVALSRIDYLATDSFEVFGHNRRFIDLAIEEISRVEHRNKFFNGLKISLVNDSEIAGKDREFLEWTEKMEKVIPPKKSFKELWPEVYKILSAT